MHTLILTRAVESQEYGTFGFFHFLDGEPICLSLERPWFDNKPFVSCIPKGTYKITIWNSPKFNRCIKIHDVPDRTHILIHPANFVNELHGCIAPGKGMFFSPPGIGESRIAFGKLISIIEEHEQWELVIY